MAKQKKYPWDKWFKYKRFTLKAGKHFTCRPYTMAQQVRNVAAERDVKVSIRILADEIKVTIKE